MKSQVLGFLSEFFGSIAFQRGGGQYKGHPANILETPIRLPESVLIEQSNLNSKALNPKP